MVSLASYWTVGLALIAFLLSVASLKIFFFLENKIEKYAIKWEQGQLMEKLSWHF